MSLVRHVTVAARGAAKGWVRGVGARARAAHADGARPSLSAVILPGRRAPSALRVGGVRGPFAVGRSICARATDAPDAATSGAVADMETAVAEAGEKIRALKAAGATNADEAVQAGVAELKALKARLAELQGPPSSGAAESTPRKPEQQQKPKQQQKLKQQQKQRGGGGGKKKRTNDDETQQKHPEGGTSSAEEVKAVRLGKVKRMRDAGDEPFAYRFDRTARASELQTKYAELKDGEEVAGDTHAVCGRVKACRKFGKLAFLQIEDDGGAVQLFVDKRRVDAGPGGDGAFKKIIDLVDMGDIVGAVGTPKRTEKGELSIVIDEFVMLTKSLLPLPDKFKGLTDTETRYRQRYVDLIASPDVRETFRARAAIVSGIRRFLDDRAFMEMETPVLESRAGGADAKPFNTFHNALGMDLTMRIAT